ncbi:lumenal Hsp70 protein [Zalaria obscura]|uniref:Lumenal Hsp70 protein n=1 Tax=Zalaria obscura TaxID=2024903 RepID=A0ACC3SFB1_9PEZI
MNFPKPGRRRSSMPSSLALLSLLLLLFTTTASAASAVLGIDLGTEYIKAAIVKPGTPLDIVPTKDSKRKEAAVVGFKPSGGKVEVGQFPERLYGGDALALAGRFPSDVYTGLKSLLGLVPGNEGMTAVQGYRERHPAIQLQAVQEMGTVVVQSPAFNAAEMPWSVEELLAMQLKNIRTNAEAMSGKGSKITDAVITVPGFYTADERRAVERAAELAGIDLMGLVSDGLAVGIDYAVKRTFPNVSKGEKPEIHLVFDMGAGSTTATVLRFQGKEVKDVGRFNKTVQEVAVIGTGWDRSLGGDALNGVVFNYIVDEFLKKPQAAKEGITAEEVKGHGRTAAKLWKEAERARQVLSANSDVRISFEGLYKDIDFATKLTRVQFEEMAESYAARINGPVIQALDAAKLSFGDLDSIILHGGAIRTPFVQKRLETLSNTDTEVRTNVNADESAAHGAAFKAAGLSPSFRVKEIRDSDGAAYAAGVTYPGDNGKERQQKLFAPSSQTGTAKQVTFKNLEDFSFTLFQHIDSQDRPVLKAQTENLTASVAALTEKFGCSKDEISTRFSIRLSPIDGLPEVPSGSVSCEVEGSGKAGGLGDSVKGLFGFGSKKGDQEPLEDAAPEETVEAGASSSASSSASGSQSTESAKAEKDVKPKKRTESIKIKLSTVPQGLPQPAPEEIQRMKERLAAFDRSDKARVAREEALNVLEAFTYRARDLLTDAGFEAASTEAVRSQLSSLLSSTSEWLYGEGYTATTEVLKGKLADLKALVEPVQKRREEAAARPEKLHLLQNSLDSTKSLIDMVAEQVAKAESAASSVAESALSSSSTPSSSSSASDDDFADLEEPETSASASTTAKPAPTPALSPYTKEDLTSVSAVYESISSWLTSKLEAQDKLSPYEDASLTVKEIEAKAQELNKVMMDLLQKKMQVPKRSSSSKKAKPTKSKKGKKSSETSASTSAPVENESGSAKPNFRPVNDDDDMPTEEEILEMVGKAKGRGGGHEEL